MNKKVLFNAIPVALIAALSFIIIYKAVNIPVTFDEVVTWQRYTSNTSITNIIQDVDGSSNNHILNSLCIKACQSFFGDSPWALRLPNIISFFLFAACLFVMAKKYFNQSLLLFCLPFICMFLNPYLVDFYSLARGYGMANAFMASSIVCLLIFSSSKKIKWYYLTILFAMLAAYSNFTFLIYWASVHLLLAGILLMQKYDNGLIKRTLAITVFMALAFAVLCYYPLKNIQQCIQSTFGDRTGFYWDTILSQANRFNYGKPLFGLSDKILSLLACLLGLVAGANFFRKIRKGTVSVFADPFNLVFLLLVVLWAVNMLQVYCFNISYLSGRTALIYYVLFAFVLIFLIRDFVISKLWMAHISAGLISLILIWHFAGVVNLKSVYEWSFDAYTYDVMSDIENYHQQHPEIKTIEFNLTNFLRPSFAFYTKNNNLPWLILDNPQSTQIDTASTALFYYTTANHITGLKSYTVAKRFKPNGILLPIAGVSPVQVLLIRK